ncbi:MAG TPA: response regulator [Phototrophicaceae bacterium]|nr:response regulator [Phototrophicaceae bacterium]
MSDTILIVDDSLTVRMDLSEAFEAAGFPTLLCADLAGARVALAQTPVGLVILDINLPDGDGVEFLKEMLSDPAIAHIPVLMLSSEAEIKDRIRGLATGATEYVGKPYDSSYVVARACELLRTNGDPQEQQATILVIDDSATVREELCQALEDAGYFVLSASNGKDGLQIAADRRPSAIVVDGVMEGMDGPTVIRRIRLDTALRDTPCVLLTASEDSGGELYALDAGADAFVRKDEGTDLILARLAAVLRSAASASQRRTASIFGPKKVLAVDDSETYLQELAGQLRGEGYDVLLARSGEEALEMLTVQPVDCVLLDLMMPGMGGRETCRQLKHHKVIRDIPVIMLTAVEDHESMIEGLTLGADDFIQKSGEFAVLKARLLAQIRRKQFEDEHRRTQALLQHTELEVSEMRAAQKLAETKGILLEELERKNKELEAFSYSVSHDLRAPLRAIMGFSSILLEDYLDNLDEQGQVYLSHIQDSAQRMSQLIDDLLSLSRVTRTPLNRQTVNLKTLAYDIVARLQAQEPDRQVKFIVDDDLMVDGDQQLLRIVLENLLGNAWKYSSKREVAVIEFGAIMSTELRGARDAAHTARHASPLIYFVRDNGAGFDMSYADKLFAPFQRLHAEHEFPGTGIGLATVQRIISRHGGQIWVEAAKDEGATFFFTVESI